MLALFTLPFAPATHVVKAATVALTATRLGAHRSTRSSPRSDRGSPPSLLTTAACGGLRSTPDCRPRRAHLHLSYSCASSCARAMLATQDPTRTQRRD